VFLLSFPGFGFVIMCSAMRSSFVISVSHRTCCSSFATQGHDEYGFDSDAYVPMVISDGRLSEYI